MSGAVSGETVTQCRNSGKISIRDSINALLDADENHTGCNDSLPHVNDENPAPSLSNTYSLSSNAANTTKPVRKDTVTIQLTQPEVNLMVLAYKEVLNIVVGEFDIDPRVSTTIPKERDSYVVLRKDWENLCCLREPIKANDIQVGQVLNFFHDTPEDVDYAWAIVDVFPITKVRKGFLKAKTTAKRRIVVPKQCLSVPVITAQYPDSEWRWFISINLQNSP